VNYPIPSRALEHHLAILGKTGSGKTTAAKAGVEQILDAGGRVAVLDPTGAWWGMKSSATGKSAGYPFVIFGGSHADFPLGATHGEAIAEIVGTSNTPAIIDTSQLKVSERTRLFTDFADAIMRKNRGPLHLIVDEAHVFMPQGKVPDPQSGQMLAAGNNMVSGGRSRGLRIMLITQRPAKLHKDSLTQVETLVAMKLIAPQDRHAVEEWIEDNADDERAREVISSLASLKTGEAWVWAPECDLLDRVRFPRIHTFDSSAAPDGSETAGVVLAPVDSNTIKDRLSKIAAEVVANDPRELKKRIAELDKQVRDLKAAPVSVVDPGAEERGHEIGWAQGYARGLEAGRQAQAEGMAAFGAAFDNAMTLAAKVAGTGVQRALSGNTKPAVVDNNARRIRSPEVRRAAPAAGRTSKPIGDSGISRPQQKILDAIAWLNDKGVDPPHKNAVAAVAGVSPTSGGYFNNLGAMKSSGLIEYPQPGFVSLTTEGGATANPPEAGGEIHEKWLEIVSDPQAKILRALIDAHPEPLHKDALAQQIGVSETSGGYFNNLGALRTLGAIDYPQKGFAALTKYVMP
jgi:hypothetical protein